MHTTISAKWWAICQYTELAAFGARRVAARDGARYSRCEPENKHHADDVRNQRREKMFAEMRAYGGGCRKGGNRHDITDFKTNKTLFDGQIFIPFPNSFSIFNLISLCNFAEKFAVHRRCHFANAIFYLSIRLTNFYYIIKCSRFPFQLTHRNCCCLLWRNIRTFRSSLRCPLANKSKNLFWIFGLLVYSSTFDWENPNRTRNKNRNSSPIQAITQREYCARLQFDRSIWAQRYFPPVV